MTKKEDGNNGNALPQEVIESINSFVGKRKNTCLFFLSTTVSTNTLNELIKTLGDEVHEVLDVILTTPGGYGDDAYKIAKALRDRCKTLNIFVPFEAKSSGTFITLAADNICLGRLGELGPLDVQLVEVDDNGRQTQKSALEEFKALEQIKSQVIHTNGDFNSLLSQYTRLNIKEIIHLSNEFTGHTVGKLYDSVEIKKLGMCSRGLEVGRIYGLKILSEFGKLEPQKANDIVKRLVYNYPSHGFVIDDIECRNLGLNIIDPGDVKQEMDSLGITLSGVESTLENIAQKNSINIDLCMLFNYNGRNNLSHNTDTNGQRQQEVGGDQSEGQENG